MNRSRRPSRFFCPFLQGYALLDSKREGHIQDRHPDLLPEHRAKIAETLMSPDRIQRSVQDIDGRLFSRWYSELRGDKHVVVVVASDCENHAVVTTYIARRLVKGEIEWLRA